MKKEQREGTVQFQRSCGRRTANAKSPKKQEPSWTLGEQQGDEVREVGVGGWVEHRGSADQFKDFSF